MNNKKSKSILLGVILIVVGVLFALKNLEIINVNLFFDGWWTLFIILPCFVGLFTEKDKAGNVVGLIIGVALLLVCQDVITGELVGKLIVPAFILLFGIRLLFRGIFKNGEKEVAIKNLKGKELRSATAVFSGSDFRPQGEEFKGAELLAVFGGVECDLRNANIKEDCVIVATAIFGGIDIFLPENVNVQTVSNSIFGGTSDKKHQNKTENTVTVYVESTAMFGGVEIK